PPPWLEAMQDQGNPVVFLDATIEHEGRLTIELFSHLVPKSAENFRSFCTGQQVMDPRHQKPVGYKRSIFHRIMKGFLVQGGDFVRFDGTGCYSIFGGLRFADERLDTKHKLGSIAMANTGEANSNGCQFFIVTTEDAAFLDGKHVVVGQVIDGMDTVRKIESVPTVGEDGKP
ncbi:U snRNP-associated cyclophilin-like protein, partial [Baffinella frigidus]